MLCGEQLRLQAGSSNGSGPTRAHSMEELKRLNIGHTYPFRGKGVGLMPAMDEVFQEFPGRSFLIDVKDNEPPNAALLTDHFSKLPHKHFSS